MPCLWANEPTSNFPFYLYLNNNQNHSSSGYAGKRLIWHVPNGVFPLPALSMHNLKKPYSPHVLPQLFLAIQYSLHQLWETWVLSVFPYPTTVTEWLIFLEASLHFKKSSETTPLLYDLNCSVTTMPAVNGCFETMAFIFSFEAYLSYTMPEFLNRALLSSYRHSPCLPVEG